jgi:hypothetical protein
MGTKFRNRDRFCGALTAVTAVMLSVPADAQNAASNRA